MSTSAFGVDHAVIRKNDDTPPSGGRQVAGALLPGWHGAVAGRKGKKLRSAGSELGGGLAGGVAGGLVGALTRKPQLAAALTQGGSLGGSVAGVHHAQKRGYYKPEKNAPVEVAKSAFGTPGDKRNTKYAGSAYAGAAAGGLIGQSIGAHQAGTTRSAYMRDLSTNIQRGGSNHVGEGPGAIFRGARAGAKATKGYKLVGRGGMAGNAAGAALGVAAYRHHRRKNA